MKVYIGADHAGFEMKEFLKRELEFSGFSVEDKGAFSFEKEDDYPDFVIPVAESVLQDSDSKGIVIGGSGQGEAIVANKFKGIRAVVYNGERAPSETGLNFPDEIVLSRSHNDANILSLGARFLSNEEALQAVLKWLKTEFSGEERHKRRIEKIKKLEKND